MNTPPSEEDSFRVVRSARRSRAALRIAPDGVLELLLPERGFPEEWIPRLLREHAPLIRRLRAESQNRPAPPRFEEGELFWYLGKRYPLHRSRRLLTFDGAQFLVPAGVEGGAAMRELYRRLGKTFFPERCNYWSEITGRAPETVHVSSAVTRWGSCSSRRHIVFSWRLLCCPDELIDYVVVHELAHLQEMNHSARFWAVVAQTLPEWRARRRELAAFGRQLPFF